jgi:hypothetical protein
MVTKRPSEIIKIKRANNVVERNSMVVPPRNTAILLQRNKTTIGLVCSAATNNRPPRLQAFGIA